MSWRRNPNPTIKPPFGSFIDPDHPLSKGQMACYVMNEGQGLTINDLSGHKNNGTLVNGTSWGEGLSFDGVNDYVDCGNNTSLDITSAITLEWEMKPLSSTALQRIFMKKRVDGVADAYTNYAAWIGNGTGIITTAGEASFVGQLIIDVGSGDGGTYTRIGTNVDITNYLDSWNSYAFTYDESTLHVSINGTLVYSLDVIQDLGANSGPLIIGKHVDGVATSGFFFYGGISRCRLYRHILSPDEIAWLAAEPYCNIIWPSRRVIFDFGAVLVRRVMSLVGCGFKRVIGG